MSEETLLDTPVTETVEAPSSDGEVYQSDLDILNQDDPAPETPEVPVVEEKPADPVVEEKPAEEEVKAEEEKPAEEAKDGKPEEPRSVKALREAIDRDPSIKAALDKNPTFRNKIYADARRSEELAAYKPHFATPDMAKQAVEDLGTLTELETNFRSPEPEAPMKLLNHLFEADIKRDPATGEPLKNADGSPQLNGSYVRFFQTYRDQALWPFAQNAIAQHAKANPDFDQDQAHEALNLVRRLLGDPVKDEPKEVVTEGFDEGQLPTRQRELLEKGKTAETQQRDADEKARTEYSTQVNESIVTGSKQVLKERVDVLAKAMPEGLRKRIIDDAYSEISQIAKGDVAYKRMVNAEFAKGTPEAKERVAAMAKNYVRERQNAIVARLVKEFSTPVVDANQKKHEKLASQSTNREVTATGGVSQPSRPDVVSMHAQSRKLMKELYGRDLKDGEVLDLDETFDRLTQEKKQRSASR